MAAKPVDSITSPLGGAMAVNPYLGPVQATISVIADVAPKIAGTSLRILPYYLDGERL